MIFKGPSEFIFQRRPSVAGRTLINLRKESAYNDLREWEKEEKMWQKN